MLETILQYIEAVASTVPDLVGYIKVIRPNGPVPNFKTYGLKIYTGKDWLVNHRLKIGPIVTQVYRINVDMVINRSLQDRQLFSDPKGISYWENLLTKLLANRRVAGLFRDSFWTPAGVLEYDADSTVIQGILEVTVDTLYDTRNPAVTYDGTSFT